LGESGAGKSSLTNLLCGREQLATGQVRRGGQGRHTTTHRELVIIPSGGVIIDTPGIRVVASFNDADGVNMAFDDVAELATQCRFSDCDHVNAPGCAIARALSDGTVDQQRVTSYLEELQAQARLQQRLTQRSRSATRKTSAQRLKEIDPTLGEVD
jgi:ribosome biogenesis GTPase